MEPLLQLLTNPIVQIFVVFYAILEFMMPFFIIRLSIKCDKLEHQLLMEHADTHDKLNYLINQQKQQKQNEN